jgi:hypothetical protein
MLVPQYLYGQLVFAPEQDCIGALPVCDTAFVQPNAYRGFGFINEISSSSCIGVERNSVWYRVRTRTAGRLGFVVEPLRPSDDYDWTVFRLPPNGTCADIISGRATEVSCNFADARRNALQRGRTGATAQGTASRQGSGGTAFNALISVQAGETYLLVITNFATSPSGYRLSFSPSDPNLLGSPDTQLPTLVRGTLLENEQQSCSVTGINVVFSKYLKCASVEPSDFEIRGPGGPYRVTDISSSRCRTADAWDSVFTLTLDRPITASGTYTLALLGVVRDLCDNAAEIGTVVNSTTLTITLSTFEPVVTGVREFCAGGTAVLTGAPGYDTYLWLSERGDTVSQDAELRTRQPGTYTLTVQERSGCRGIVRVAVRERVGALPVAVQGVRQICPGGSTVLDAGEFSSYQWSTGSRTRTITVTQPGMYAVTVRDVSGCEGSAQVPVTVRTSPLVTRITGPYIICEPAFSSIVIDGGLNEGREFEEYQWFFNGVALPNSNRRFVTVSDSGRYTVRVAAQGCRGESPVYGVLRSNAAQKPTVIVNGNTLTSSAAEGYQWFDDNGLIPSAIGRTFSPPRDGRYRVLITAAGGCQAFSDTVVVQRIDASAVLGVHNAQARVGATVELPVLLSAAVGMRESGATSLVATLRFNARLLIPEPNQAFILRDSVSANRERFVRLRMPLQPENASTTALVRLRCLAVLGNTIATNIVLHSVHSEPPGAIILSTGASAQFSLVGVPSQGGLRLVDEPVVRLAASPNPVTDHITARYTLAQPETLSLIVLDATGNIVETLLHQQPTKAGKHELKIPTDKLPQGAYFLVLRTAEGRYTHSFTVLR